MILDTLDNAHLYEPLGEGFAKAFAYLCSARPATDPIGSHQLDGKALFVNVEEYTSKPIEKGRYESHRKYADVQYVVSGSEQMGYAPINTLSEIETYDPGRDVAFYKGQGTMLHVPAGSFAVFFPQDGHMPCIADDEPAGVRKVVVKVRING